MNKRKGPWVIKGTKVVYQNPWIKVIEDKVIRPDGKNGIYGVVEQKPGVAVVPIDKNGNVYLIEEFRYAIGVRNIEIPTGGIDTGENKLQAAKRELKEETGFTAKKWIYLGVVHPYTSVINSPCYLYLAMGLTEGNHEQEGTETIKVIKMTFKRVIDFVMKSKINHGASCVALLKVNSLNNIK